MRVSVRLAALAAFLLTAGCATSPPNGTGFDLVIRGGTIYDGSGGEPVRADLGIRGDRIAAIGNLSNAKAARTVDATGMAVAPGFVNVLSWAPDSLMADGRGVSDSLQGVTSRSSAKAGRTGH